MDLTKTFPRSPRETLAGYAHLARMVDKVRAKLAGTIGEYVYPCPMDQRLLDFAGMTAEQFTEAVTSYSADGDVAAWFQRTAKPHSPVEVADWNQTLLTRGPDTEEKRAYFRSERDRLDPTRTDITSWADLLDLEEGRPVPIRPLEGVTR
ncbi:MAG: DUF5069 domain-containing protein [Nitrospirae bacterium]|nr:DUF5069 domain-containing protein [Nitrospirota bacterium]